MPPRQAKPRHPACTHTHHRQRPRVLALAASTVLLATITTVTLTTTPAAITDNPGDSQPVTSDDSPDNALHVEDHLGQPILPVLEADAAQRHARTRCHHG